MLHVANGSATIALLEAARLPGTKSIWADPLHDGPVPGDVADGALSELRARHLAESFGLAVEIVAADLRRWRAVVQEANRHEEVVLWFEHDLFDQLNLVQVLDLLHDMPSLPSVSMVTLDRFPGVEPFIGLGQLRPADISELFGRRQPVGSAEAALGRRAWNAFRARTPTLLEALASERHEELPFLAAALTRFLEDYPWTTDGLSRTERALLTAAMGEFVTLGTAMRVIHARESVFYVADSSLLAVATRLASGPTPLLEMRVGTGDGPWAARHAFRTTDDGRHVLEGTRDRWELCTAGRWCGGVHLVEGAPRWRWDPARRCLVEQAPPRRHIPVDRAGPRDG